MLAYSFALVNIQAKNAKTSDEGLVRNTVKVGNQLVYRLLLQSEYFVYSLFIFNACECVAMCTYTYAIYKCARGFARLIGSVVFYKYM